MYAVYGGCASFAVSLFVGIMPGLFAEDERARRHSLPYARGALTREVGRRRWRRPQWRPVTAWRRLLPQLGPPGLCRRARSYTTRLEG
jgi:hypothetical protein